MLAKWSIHIFLILIVHQRNSNMDVKRIVAYRLINTWAEQVQNIHSNPILRTYCNIKYNFGMDTYLDAIKNYKYRVAMSQLRTSSHTLAIEYGRYTRPKTKFEDRNCSFCHILDDERHFLIECNINQTERENLFSKLSHIAPNFIHMTEEDKFLFLMCIKDQQILTWVGKFIYKSFKDRDEYLSFMDTMRCASPLHWHKVYWVYISLPVWMHVYRYSINASTPMNYIFIEFHTLDILRHAISLIVLCVSF